MHAGKLIRTTVRDLGVWLSLCRLGLMLTVVYSSILRSDVCGSAVLRDSIGAFDCRISKRNTASTEGYIQRSRTA